MSGPQVSYDATSIVRCWASGQQNDGFDLPGKCGPAAPYAPRDGSTCLTTNGSVDIDLVVRRR